MSKSYNGIFSKNSTRLLWGIVLSACLLIAPLASADFDYIFFSINGDTTGSTMTQGDEFSWGSNCEIGATINWEVWYDVNSNSTIDPTMDFMLTSENITDGHALTEPDPILDGWVIGETFYLAGEPGEYLFKATDIATDSSIQKNATMLAMPSPPNRFTGQINLPGISAPNSLLANRMIFAESDSGEEGVFLALTDNMGEYSMNVGAVGTGVTFYLDASNVSGFVKPDYQSATASGVVGNIDFTYITAVDSVWGFVKDEIGSLIGYETDVRAESDFGGKNATTMNGRYAIYFSSSEKGEWNLESDSRNSPTFLSPNRFEFSHDTLTSFQHDIILTRTNAMIYARVTENGGLPTSNYRIDAYSSSLSIWTEAVSGTGSNNIAPLYVTSLDPSGWEVFISTYDDDFPIPLGLVTQTPAFSVAPGDTVDLNLIDGQMVTGTITQDPEDAPINWDDVYVYGGSGSIPDGSGNYALYIDYGFWFVGVYADGYTTDPEYKMVQITGDTTGLDFVINHTHCRVSGTLTGVTLPLGGSYYGVSAYTGTMGVDGYTVYGQVDSVTGTFEMYLCDGDWTIQPPFILGYDIPAMVELTIGEIPDTVRTQDFDYGSAACCGMYTSGYTGNTDCNPDGKRNLGDITRLIDRVYITKTPLCCTENGNVNGDAEAKLDLGDITRLIDHVYVTKVETEPCM